MSRFAGGQFAKPENALKRAVRIARRNATQQRAAARARPRRAGRSVLRRPARRPGGAGGAAARQPVRAGLATVRRALTRPAARCAASQEELINVGQKNSALQALHDVITSKVRSAAPRNRGLGQRRQRAWRPAGARLRSFRAAGGPTRLLPRALRRQPCRAGRRGGCSPPPPVVAVIASVAPPAAA
jgi:hypothetical protein